MKRKLLSSLLVLMLCLSLACPVFAAQSRLTDNAGLLTAAQERSVTEKLNSVSQEYQVDVLVMTVLSTGGLSPDSFIHSRYDSLYGEEHNGVLLVVDMGGRTYRILSNGSAAKAISPDAIDAIGRKIEPYLADGDYAKAFMVYADECADYLDVDIHGFPFAFGKNLLISLVIGFVTALIVTGVMRGQLKSVRQKTSAGDYVKSGSMQLTQSSDIFLYRNITRQARPKDNAGGGSSRGGSSGGSRNVGGGRF